ncbi:MAG: RHS repeat-associated core domain-containing protein, partial [Fibrobacterota bacterium]
SATLRSWDQPNTTDDRSQTFTYDVLRRPLTRSVTANGSTYVAEMTTYGESLVDAKARNARGQAYSHKDGAGIATDEQRDFHGKVTKSVRQLTTDAKTIPDWSLAVAVDETFTTTTAYDALGRVIQIDTPHNTSVPASQVYPVYNEANLLDKVQLKLRGAATATDIVTNTDYDAKGQRQRIAYGNGSTTRYDHDPLTYRLTRLLTTRSSGTETLQELSYTYDPSGNVVQITDDALQTTYFNNQVVRPDAFYEYDALYRLIKASGREHINNGAATEPEAEGFNAAQPLKDDGAALRNYTRAWIYDHVGNILSLIHTANAGNWTRAYAYATDSNRLASTTVNTTTQTYTHNAYGSFTAMPHLDAMEWTADEHLHKITRGTSQTWYTYDSTGQRVRKYTEKGGITEERLYLGGFEIYRKRQGTTVTLERETLHLMDGNRRIALVETKTVDTSTALPLPSTVTRYQLDNHLQSATLELDETAQVISYEEYYPYGDTSYRSSKSGTEVSEKRYRYTGKEKDEESGLYYHGARYYAAWLGRWTAADPAGMVDGACLYAYVRNHPTGLVDPDGRAADSTNQTRHLRDRNLDGYALPGGISRIENKFEQKKTKSQKQKVAQQSARQQPQKQQTTKTATSLLPESSPLFASGIFQELKIPIPKTFPGGAKGTSAKFNLSFRDFSGFPEPTSTAYLNRVSPSAKGWKGLRLDQPHLGANPNMQKWHWNADGAGGFKIHDHTVASRTAKMVGQSLNYAKPIARGALVVGVAIDAANLSSEISKSSESGDWSNTTRTASSIAGGWVGAWAGAKATGAGGAIIGSAFGPVGTIVGGAVGGIAGGFLGYYLGSKAGSNIHDAATEEK